MSKESGSGFDYTKRVGDRIYVRGSCYAPYSSNSFNGAEALEIASELVTHANGTSGRGTKVTLTLERDEAEALAAVLNRVGGDRDKSPRGKTAKVAAKLVAAGVERPTFKFEAIAGGLWFLDYDGTPIDPLAKMLAQTVYGWGE